VIEEGFQTSDTIDMMQANIFKYQNTDPRLETFGSPEMVREAGFSDNVKAINEVKEFIGSQNKIFCKICNSVFENPGLFTIHLEQCQKTRSEQDMAAIPTFKPEILQTQTFDNRSSAKAIVNLPKAKPYKENDLTSIRLNRSPPKTHLVINDLRELSKSNTLKGERTPKQTPSLVIPNIDKQYGTAGYDTMHSEDQYGKSVNMKTMSQQSQVQFTPKQPITQLSLQAALLKDEKESMRS
jgi:hypothetical protein